MGRGIGEVINTLMSLLPPWAVAIIAGVILVAAIPGLIHNARSKQIRSAIRRRVRAMPPEQRTLADRAIERAGRDIHLFALVAKEARKRSMPDLYQRALEGMEALDGGRALATEIRAETAPKKLDPIHVLEAVARVRVMLEEGAVEAASARLDEALDLYPGDPELLALTDVVRAARTEAQ